MCNETKLVYNETGQRWETVPSCSFDDDKFPEIVRAFVHDKKCNYYFYAAEHFVSQSAFVTQVCVVWGSAQHQHPTAGQTFGRGQARLGIEFNQSSVRASSPLCLFVCLFVCSARTNFQCHHPFLSLTCHTPPQNDGCAANLDAVIRLEELDDGLAELAERVGKVQSCDMGESNSATNKVRCERSEGRDYRRANPPENHTPHLPTHPQHTPHPT